MSKSFKLRFEDAVFASDDLTLTERVVALAWAHRSNYATGMVNDTIKTSQLQIAKKIGGSERTVRDNTKSLEAKGWLVSTPRPGHVSLMQLVIPATPAAFAGVENEDVNTEDIDPGSTFRGTPAGDSGVMATPRQEMPVTPAADSDNKNTKNLNTKKEEEEGGGYATADSDSLLSTKVEASSLGNEVETPSLVDEDADSALVDEVVATPATNAGVLGKRLSEIEAEVNRQAKEFGWPKGTVTHIMGRAKEAWDSQDDVKTLVDITYGEWVEVEW